MNATSKRIGGSFAPEALPQTENAFLASLLKPGDDLVHMMSGRCGIMLSIMDFMQSDKKRVAYLPAYTCETVSGCFYKLGYRVRYYGVDQALNPLYDEGALGEISLALLCGYFGFPQFDAAFAQQCKARGIGIVFDATHSLFTRGGIPEEADYVAGSMRKVLPVACGGIAIKRGGRFSVDPEPIHEEHLRRRYRFFDDIGAAGDDRSFHAAAETFWEAELLLREVYGAQESDERSIEVVKRYPFKDMIDRRAANFKALLAAFPQAEHARPVFHEIADGVCPTHFPLYSDAREALMAHLRERNILSTVYWPVPPFIEDSIGNYPGAKWVYDHILSLPIDQRYGPEDMRRMAAAISDFQR